MAQRTADYTGEDSYVHAGRVIGDIHRFPKMANLPYFLEVTSIPYLTRLSVAV